MIETHQGKWDPASGRTALPDGMNGHRIDLALLISCVGRRVALGQRVEEELEGVRRVLGDRAALAGFYSHGEISPFSADTSCQLHNQTRTITTFTEA